MKERRKMGKVLGIDLGTTNSCMAVVENGEPVVIPNAEGNRTTPSVVAFRKDGERLVGELAKRQAVTNPERTIRSIKRKMGTRDRIRIDGRDYSPEEISAMILQKLKTDAEAYLGEKITQAVITVPAYFDDSQRTATKNAGEIAGLEVLRIINEPTAASLAYGLDKKADETILVYDLGGGTFDVSLLEVGEGVFEVKATAGNTHLGGDDFDQRIVDYLVREFKREQGIDLSKDRQAMQRLLDEAEKAKKELSSVVSTRISLPFISATPDGPVHLEMEFTRAKFDELTADLVQKTVGPFEQAMRDAKISVGDMDEVVLVGGATRMPSIQALVRRLSGKEPHKGVNPDEVVAIGAAIQAGVLSGQMEDIVLLDVTPLSLGIETLGGVFTRLIERNTTIPTRKSDIFSTAADGQTAVDIQVYQGERPRASDNKLLGTFRLDGIPPAPRGIPQIEVTFDIDANGIVNVSAKDKATGKEQKITITNTGALTSEEIERMVREAEQHADEDRKFREAAEARNRADSLAYQIERMLKDHGDKLPAKEKEQIEQRLSDVREALKDGDVTRINSASRALEEASYKLSEFLYQQAAGAGPEMGAGSGGAGPTPKRPADEDVIDADFTASDEK